MSMLKESGFDCTEDSAGNVRIKHFPREYIWLEQHNGQFVIKNGVVRHLLLALVLTLLFVFMNGNVWASGLISTLGLYSYVQSIRITIITSSLNVILSSFIVMSTSK
ncbi:hypothetical protein [Thalassotalea sp. PS06]|uniref:hypothetical protein n=1 Tax=Thalassotalea sp. PS06 TaxID=2594005 RepID=UPI001164BF54|nr:hypothetical protein [Thalassotalea sp. PS06]QDP01090.1 hypothetical protein FNC98_06900 [Thalassotalea sp. PS06]